VKGLFKKVKFWSFSSLLSREVFSVGVKEGVYLEDKENESKEIDEVSKEVYVDVLSAMIHKAFSQDHRGLTEQSIERKRRILGGRIQEPHSKI